MGNEYVVFVESLDDLKDGQENEIVVRSLSPGIRKYRAHYVRALLAGDPGRLSGGDILWVRFAMGVLYPKPWGIRILSEIGDFMPGKIPGGKGG